VMEVDEIEALGNGQFIRVRASTLSNPPLLLVQQGPGLPMINEVRRFEHLLKLEQEFTVIYWDQRGCGLSLRSVDGRPIGVLQMVDDTVSLLELLHERFNSKVYVAGFSFGATLAAFAATRRPDLVANLVAVGMDIDGDAAGTSAYEFALDMAVERGIRRAVRQLEAVGPPPHLTTKKFTTRARWASNFGGVSTDETYSSLVRRLLVSLIRSDDYSVLDSIRTIRGIGETQAALLKEMAELDLVRALPLIDVPVVMVQGRLDQVAPGEQAQNYFDCLAAPSKDLVWFEASAHTPHLEEPAKFRDLLLQRVLIAG
jgi:pimeloyl-ACP methyl ester carboxylesterase